MNENQQEEFMNMIIIAILISSIFAFFLNEKAGLLRDRWMNQMYNLTFSLNNLTLSLDSVLRCVWIFGVMAFWVALDLIGFIGLFNWLYWKDIRKNPPMGFKATVINLLILLPAATIPWITNQLFILLHIEPNLWVHGPYIVFWVLLLAMAIMIKKFCTSDR